METAVRFNKFCEDFNDNEFDIFMKKIYSKYGKREILRKAMTQYLIYDGKNANYLNKDIGKFSADIVAEREQNKKEIKEKKCDNDSLAKLNEIPSPLIAEYSSYLQLIDIAKLLKVCRQIYVSIKSHPGCIHQIRFKQNPNFLKLFVENFDLKFSKIHRFHRIDALKTLSLTKDVTINPSHLTSFYQKYEKEWIWNNVDKLTLDFGGASAMKIQEFLDVFENNLKGLKYLKQCSIKNIDDDDDSNERQDYKLISLFSINPNIENLILSRIRVKMARDIDDCLYSRLRKLKLKSLYLLKNVNYTILPLLLYYTGGTLQELGLNVTCYLTHENPDDLLSKIQKLDKVKKLTLSGFSNYLFPNELVKKMNILKLEYLDLNINNLYDKNGGLTSFLETVLTEQQQLTYIHINDHKSLLTFFDIIKNKNIRFKELEINNENHILYNNYNDEKVLEVRDVLNGLHQFVTNKLTFKCSGSDREMDMIKRYIDKTIFKDTQYNTWDKNRCKVHLKIVKI